MSTTFSFGDISPLVVESLIKIARLSVKEQRKSFSIGDFYPYIKREAWLFGKLEDAGYIERVPGNSRKWHFTYEYLQCLVYNSIDVKS